MKDFSPCFGENDVQVAESSFSSTRASENVASSVYQCESQRCSCFITVTWTKTFIGEDLCVAMDNSGDRSLCDIEIQPWLFSTKKGSQTLLFSTNKLELFWDLTSAKLAHGPEPLEGFYLAVVLNQELALLLGDLKKEACKKIEDYGRPHYEPVLISRREHIYGKRFYSAKTQFRDKGQMHEITIEFGFDTVERGPCLEIQVDRKTAMEVKRLDWKFRGNQTIWVDGFPVEVIWDVHGWLFGEEDKEDYAVFMFQTHFSMQKMRAYQSDEDSPAATKAYTQQLMEQTQTQGPDFTLALYAWKIDY